ncbi:hypothetical protein F6S87_01165 [Bifidobacterium sp. BRDM6]|uniref:Glycosyl hydrolase family 13 catalytic domain-containing protein n=2 Tax=Bifidobacterium choloepi TaxID=2614131 RepID=A0A6I5MYA3_9BIFI|nr:alpha-amylase family glycosyl hydrolase [Bifidobacterium choloepi]NEG69257.1 hypothetical protein [Bifidobacterium choloepi]
MTPAQAAAIDAEYRYDGDDLGAVWGPGSTTFKVWAPTASEVDLVVFDDDRDPHARESSRIPMSRLTLGDEIADGVAGVNAQTAMKSGVWTVTVDGNCADVAYVYRLTFPDGTVNDSPDPYATATVANGRRSVVLSDEQRSIGDFPRMAPFGDPTTAVVAETHIRDFTKSPTSGVPAALRGTYLGVVEPGTTSAAGQPTGLDYLKRLGITHLQIQPMFDFASVDETAPLTDDNYNWGYDPENYNVPEGSFSTDVADPAVRIRELKTMVKGLHDAGLRVIMDVVYNHVFDAVRSPLGLTVPGYYFRADDDGVATNDSECGNDTASERAMMRKYIVDSVTYWAREYRLDGFRFDLMGLHDVGTMQAVRRALDDIDPGILIVGEGWDMCSVLPKSEMAIQMNAAELTDPSHVVGAASPVAGGESPSAGVGQAPSVAFFNDSIRDGLKGHVFYADELGYVSGEPGLEPLILHNMLGSGTAMLGSAGESDADYALPGQVVNYCEIHDNFTLYDKLEASVPSDDEETRVRRAMLADAAVFLAEGVAEMQVGQEFLRTKGGDDNSYRSGDSVNALDWDRQDRQPYMQATDYVRGLVALRRAVPAFRLATYAEIAKAATVLQAADGVVAYTVADPSDGAVYLVALNANDGKDTDKDTDAKVAADTRATGKTAVAKTVADDNALAAANADGSVDLTLPATGEWTVLVAGGHVADVDGQPLGAATGTVHVAPLDAVVLRH